MVLIPPHARSLLHILGHSLLSLLLVLALPAAWAGPAPVAGTSASATVTGTSPVTIHFPLTRSGDSAYGAWIRYATKDGTALAGTSYTAAGGAVQVPAGATGASIPVQILGASGYSPDKQFSLKFLSAVGVGPAPTFAANQSFAVGALPDWTTAADVNGDGKQDLIVVNGQDKTVSVLLNTTSPGASTPSFAAQQTFGVGSSPFGVTAADVNGDGKPDLIVTNNSAFTVSILLNTTPPGAATPSFSPQQTFTVGGYPALVRTADINGDGKPDLIVTNNGDNTVSVLLNATTPGASTSTFSPVKNFLTAPGPFGIATEDVNGDGKPDLIVADSGSNTVSVLLNTTSTGAATPSFAAQQTFATGNQPYMITTADVNGDGKPDLIVTNYGDATASVLLNTTTAGAATPSFNAQQTFATGNHPLGIAAVDVNGDGKPDLALSNMNDNTISVLTNTTAAGASTPSFDAQQTFATGNHPLGIAAVDVNGDGKPDLIATDNVSPGTISVLMNTTATSSAVAPSFAAQQPFNSSQPISVTSADINGDGKPDLIIANKSNNTVSVRLDTTTPGATIPNFTSPQAFPTGTQPYSVTTADVNGDGKPDLIVANRGSNTVSVLLNTTSPGAATPNFTVQNTFATGSNPAGVTAADMNSDGKPDLIVTNGDSTYTILINATSPGASSPSFTTQTMNEKGGPDTVTTADINGDGKPDLIVGDYLGEDVRVYLNTTVPGAATLNFGALQAYIANGAGGFGPFTVMTADINGDGRPDILAFAAGLTWVLINRVPAGSTILNSSSSFASNHFAFGFNLTGTTADVNGDGKSDLILAGDTTNSSAISVRLNTTTPGAATSTFGAPWHVLTQGTPGSITTMDINGDGGEDIVAGEYPLDAYYSYAHANSFMVLLNTQYAASVSPASVTGTIHYAIPQVLLSPSPLAFGNVLVGSNSTKTETLTNSGGASLSISSIALGGTNVARFAQSNNCPSSLAIGASCVIQMSYTPNALTTDNAALKVSTNEPNSPDTVTLSGTGSDTAPTANNGTLTTSTNTAANGTLSVTNPDSGQTLTFSIVAQPAHGTITITNAATGAYTYTPASGYAGSDSFTFKANDGYLDSNLATVSVTVADTPPTAIGASFSTSTNQALSGQLQGNANDVGQTLTFALAQAPTHGKVTVNANGSFSYTPATGYAGSDAFTFTVNDEYLNSTPATVSITVNDTAPTASNASFSTPLNTAYSGQLQATNPDSGQTLTYSIVSQPSHGTVSITNTATGAYTYTPNTGYLGSDSFIFKANDGYLNSNTATVSASVTDKPPVAQGARYNVTANRYVSGHLKATASSSSQTLTYAIVTKPAEGTVSLDAKTGQFTYIPNHNYTGTDSFTFKASDGTLDSNTAMITLKVVTGALAEHNGAGGGAFGPWGLALLAGLAGLIALLRKKPHLRNMKVTALALGMLLTGSVLFTATPARAADTGPWYVGIQGNVLKAASGRNSATAGFKGWTLLFGRHLGKHFALEIDRASYSDYPETLTATANWVNWGLRGLYFPWKSQGAFAPFVFAGAGHQYEYQGDNSELSNNSASLGLGFTSQPWSAPVAIRADIEAQHGFGSGYTDKIFSLGMVFGFGAAN